MAESVFKKKQDRALSGVEARRLYDARQTAKVVGRKESQRVFLKRFHENAAGRSQEQRVALLRDVAETIRFSVVGLDELKRRRRAFDSCKNVKFPVQGQCCWVCGGMTDIIRHHIIQLQNGGGPQIKANVVFLCGYCHAEVHPWLSLPAVPVSAAEFKLAGAKARASEIIERSARGRYGAFEVAQLELVECLRSVFNNLAM